MWIESHTTLGQHPKVARLARALDVSKPTSVGHLHLFWHWVAEFAPEGDVTGFDAAEIAEAGQWPGDPAIFVRELVRCGWLDRDGKRLEVHDWLEHSGRLIERRRQDATRKRAQRRGNSADSSTGRPQDVQWTSSGRPAYQPTDQPTEQDQTHQPTDPLGQAAENAAGGRMDGGGFVDLWAIWPNKRQRKDAESAFGELSPNAELLGIMVQAVGSLKSTVEWRGERGPYQYAPQLGKWLRDHGWKSAADADNVVPLYGTSEMLAYEQSQGIQRPQHVPKMDREVKPNRVARPDGDQ